MDSIGDEVIKEIIGPGIVIYKNVFLDSLSLIKRYEKIIKETQNFSWSASETNQDGFPKNLTRVCKDFIYDRPPDRKQDDASNELRSLYDSVVGVMKDCLLDYQKDYPVEVEYFESLNIVKYDANNFFNYHTDDGKNSRYTVSCVGYLNDDYEGGELHFKFFNVVYSPSAGDLAIFPSAYIYAHAAYPIRSGTKYVAALMTDRTELGHLNDLIE
jgi:hypothetical protein